jgi:hypothetical protein
MEATVKPVRKVEKLEEYLKPRTKNVEKVEQKKLKVELEEPSKLSKIPGIEKYKVEGETFDGIGGTPIHQKALAKIENRKDAARAFLATLDGYTLYIQGSERSWDVQALKKYNSEIMELKDEKTAELFNFDKKINCGEEQEKFDVSETQLLKIYMKFLTH